MAVKRGEVWLVELDPTQGSEIRKTRPCLMGSPPEIHNWLRTALVAPMTTKSRAVPFRIPVAHGGKDGLILLEQIRAVDQSRLLKRLGVVSQSTLHAVLETLRELFEP